MSVRATIFVIGFAFIALDGVAIFVTHNRSLLLVQWLLIAALLMVRYFPGRR